MIYFIGIFLIAIIFEVLYSRRKGLRVYYFGETLSHLTAGIGQQAINIILISFLALLYSRVKTSYGLVAFDRSSVLTWAGCFLLLDLVWYGTHRMSHRVNFFIAAHSVHHQAEDFNLASALRQSWTNRLVIFIFYLPLALFGMPVDMLLACVGMNTFIQFFSHFGATTKHLGVFEYVLVTPRSHRVHHGTNGDYIDKNFGGVLIIWDRLFGTYKDLDEKIAVQVGPVKPFNYYNPIRANLNYFQRIGFVSLRRTGLSKFTIWFESPESLEAELARYEYVESSNKPDMRRGLPKPSAYTAAALLFSTFLVLIYFMKNAADFSLPVKTAFSMGIILAVCLVGRILSSKTVEVRS